MPRIFIQCHDYNYLSDLFTLQLSCPLVSLHHPLSFLNYPFKQFCHHLAQLPSFSLHCNHPFSYSLSFFSNTFSPLLIVGIFGEIINFEPKLKKDSYVFFSEFKLLCVFLYDEMENNHLFAQIYGGLNEIIASKVGTMSMNFNETKDLSHIDFL